MTSPTAIDDRPRAEQLVADGRTVQQHADEADWRRWRAERLALGQAPHGIAAAVATVWLGEAPIEIDGLDGLWRTDGTVVLAHGAGPGTAEGTGVVAGVDSEPTRSEVSLAIGESLELGDKLVRVVAREARLAARVFDPRSEARTALAGIEAFDWQPEWQIEADFEPEADRLRVDQADGGSAEFPIAGRLRFAHGGQEYALLGFRTETGLYVSFGDSSNGAQTKQFRFLDVPLSEPHDSAQRVTLDFNRAYLPPCSFAPAYLCPLPPSGNRLDFAVLAGERRQLQASHADPLAKTTAATGSARGTDR